MTLFIIIGILAMILVMMIYGAFASQKWHRENRGKEIMMEDQSFHFRLFYYNTHDPRLFVPKRTGGGYTINFANPFSVISGFLLIAGLLVFIFMR